MRLFFLKKPTAHIVHFPNYSEKESIGADCYWMEKLRVKVRNSFMLSKIENFLEKYKDKIFWTLLVCAYVLAAILFCAQSFRFKGLYLSDLDLHINSALRNGGSGYSMESTLVALIYWLTGKNAVACKIIFPFVLAFVILMTPLAVASLHSFLDRTEEGTSLGVSRNRYVGLFSIYIGPLVLPFIWFWFNTNNYNINAWHNSTFLEMRLFSVISLCLYFVIQADLRKGKRIRPSFWLMFTACMFVSTWFKPSFFVGFAPVIAIWILIDMLQSHGKLDKIKDQFLLGCTCIPSGLMVIMQYWKLYGSRENISVVISSEMDDVNDNIRILLFLILPVIIFLFNRKKVISEYKNGNRAYVQIIAMWLFNLLYTKMFVEIEKKKKNIGWGVRLANYIVVIIYLRLFWINLLDLRKKIKEGQTVTTAERVYAIGVGAVLAWEMICGLFYFFWVLIGQGYMI